MWVEFDHWLAVLIHVHSFILLLGHFELNLLHLFNLANYFFIFFLFLRAWDFSL